MAKIRLNHQILRLARVYFGNVWATLHLTLYTLHPTTIPYTLLLYPTPYYYTPLRPYCCHTTSYYPLLPRRTPYYCYILGPIHYYYHHFWDTLQPTPTPYYYTLHPTNTPYYDTTTPYYCHTTSYYPLIPPRTTQYCYILGSLHYYYHHFWDTLQPTPYTHTLLLYPTPY